MRSLAASLSLAAVIAALPPAAAGSSSPPPKVSPPGQVQVVTVNARQRGVLDVKRFTALLELALALQQRPFAFDGGASGAVTAPDVVALQELRGSNVEILARLLRQRFGYRYRAAGSTSTAGKLMVNYDTVTPVGEAITWPDACPSETHDREYQAMRFVETASNLPFVVAAIHFRKSYPEGAQCLTHNARTLRLLMQPEASPVIVGGDFNRRPVMMQRECDVYEESEPLEWWTELTTRGPDGRGFLDAVRDVRRRGRDSFAREWTHEQKRDTVGCDGSIRVRRSRIDYLFARDATTAEAGADDPGWAGSDPGTRHRRNYKYSDHRFVSGRFVIGGPPQPARPSATSEKGGTIGVAWEPSPEVARWVVYRAARGTRYRVLDRVPAEVTSIVDDSTSHGRPYRYAVAGVGFDGAQGLESRVARAAADGRGPRAVGVTPAPGSTSVRRDAKIRVRFDEAVLPASVGEKTITLFKGERRVAGSVRQVSAREVLFRPWRRLKKDARYNVVVLPVRDTLGNPSSRFSWSFRT